MFHSVNLSDYMLHNPAKIHQNADLFDAVAVILEGRISGLCVVDDHNNLVGVLSELDCLGATLSSSYDGGRNVGAVRDYMTPVQQVAVASPGDDIVDVARDMLRNKHRRRPVVREGKLVGQITCRQLLRAIKEFSLAGDQRRAANA
ncbi:MAG TPA: CBS domain-containing protein [Porticoccaceae bacterium]|jgi:CBS domain-containing protein|nr:CBS domain-containing protein [Pseudomonadota bacterium]HLS98084.1 CBS domain-containing protein [Porticoccaceae bacterium]